MSIIASLCDDNGTDVCLQYLVPRDDGASRLLYSPSLGCRDPKCAALHQMVASRVAANHISVLCRTKLAGWRILTLNWALIELKSSLKCWGGWPYVDLRFVLTKLALWLSGLYNSVHLSVLRSETCEIFGHRVI